MSSRKRKRGQEREAEHPSFGSQERRPSKRVHTSPSSCVEKKSPQTSASVTSEGSTDPLKHWIKTGKWREEDFEQDSKVREDLEKGKESKRRDWSQVFRGMHVFTHLHDFFARKKSSASFRREQSQSTISTSSDQSSRETKSSQYDSPDYEIKLERKGSYMREYDDIDEKKDNGKNMKAFCTNLLKSDQTVPQDSLFRNDLFEETCEKVRNRNEAIIVQDITRLIVPSAMNLAIYGAKNLSHLYETVNESWTSMIEFEGPLPQPDYSVGFGRSAFTSEQLAKLKPFVGEPGSSELSTYFMATTRMYFPFLTCEVNCALDIADRQNAQSMSIALRAFVVLFRSVKREEELNQQILAFSISHDDRSVRIYGHYPVIEKTKTAFYRHLIRAFDFTDGEEEEKWTAYKFTRNVYDIWMPNLHHKIRSAIDALPADLVNLDLDLSQSASWSHSASQGSLG